ncbi:MAG: type I DNA topoisomerase, partial [Campylobacter sp.]|nr:type I DNA topoisomerase [Campylobacter sp.]
MSTLIIVESPAKAKTIKNFLGRGYDVIASLGHIRDLPKSSFGIKIEDGEFIPEYRITADHSKIVKEIKEKAKSADKIYLATDEDREGEAIAFHIAAAIGKDPLKLPRIVFHEITKSAIDAALKNPRSLDMASVNAQQARRLLDRIVGYKLSPLLSQKIQSGLSAGRVQSAALKIIVDREREIQAFVPQRYFSIEVLFKTDLEARLVSFKGKKLDKLDISSGELADEILASLKKSSFIISKIESKERKTTANPPFMTSTLQQSASNRLGFSPKRTMALAQQLYEGVNTPNGQMGAITYMRTDSLNIAEEAREAAAKLIEREFGKEYLPPKPNIYASKAKGAQEAHEAIRPTNVEFSPQIAAKYLEKDLLKLYTLIYNRFVSSQMSPQITLNQVVSVDGGECELKISGRKTLFDGFARLWAGSEKDVILPELSLKEELKLQKSSKEEHFTEPPARYSEAGLVKKLESLGIGRPSTYAPTITLLTSREYVSTQNKQLVPNEIAFKITAMLEANFTDIVDSDFTSNLEKKLDDIAEKGANWQKVLGEFYEPFIAKISEGKTAIESQKV